MNNQILHICLAFDDAYVEHAMAAMASVAVNSCAAPVFHILTCLLSKNNESDLQKFCRKLGVRLEIHRIDSENYFGQFPIWPGCPQSKAVYLRLAIPDILSIDIERAIYIDSDLICCGDIAELAYVDISDCLIAAVPDESEERHRKMIGTDRYVNSGVILFNLKKWRENITLHYLSEAMSSHADFICPDQDLINLACAGRIKLLPIEWNAQTVGTNRGFALGHDDKRIPKKIVHFITSHKPWSIHCKSGYQWLYFKYLMKTPYWYKASIYPIFKFLKFLFEKKNINADSKYVIILGMPILKRKYFERQGIKYKTYYLLGLRLFTAKR